jgi:hypothetical protein
VFTRDLGALGVWTTANLRCCLLPVPSLLCLRLHPSGGTGDEGGDDVVLVPVQVASGAVVSSGCTGIGVTRGDLDVA